jgi:hypothetical protein
MNAQLAVTPVVTNRARAIAQQELPKKEQGAGPAHRTS